MPSLQRFTTSKVVLGCPPLGSDSIARYQEAIIDFLSTHGRRLLYLHIGVPLRFTHRFSSVLEHCPLLERLVMHPATFERMNWIPDNQVLHTKLRFLDLTYSFNTRLSYADSKLWISKEVLPSLQLVRHLCDIPSYLSTWVDSFEPCSEVGSTDFTIQISQHQVIYKDDVLLYKFMSSVWEGATNDESWWFSVWEDEPSDSETSSNETSSESEDDEWMFDSEDDPSALSPWL